MRGVYDTCFYIALSQAGVGIILLIVAAAISAAQGPDAAFGTCDDGSRPPGRWLALIGAWLVLAAVAEMTILWVCFFPVRRA